MAILWFNQLVRTLEPIISILKDKQNDRSFHGFLSTGSKVRLKTRTISTFQDKQNERSCQLVQKLEGINVYQSFVLFQTNKTNCHIKDNGQTASKVMPFR